uniref:B cell linker n=1 Tax=Nomascus leucogenys TaxID=61853 RepID=A0A2I3G5U7_NOMLE
MDKLNKITVPASQKLRQLQKMVHDIKNNEGGIMNKIKKLKVKAPPSVPRRDYASESPADEEEQWSDDFNRSSQRHSPPFSKTLPSKSSWPSEKARLTSTLPALTALQKPQVPPKPKGLLEDEADYVVPVEDNDENYIHPTESSSPPPEKGRNSGAWETKSPSPAAPSPLPRAGKKPTKPLKTTPVASQQNASSVCEEKPIPAERHRGSSHRQEAVQSPVFPPAQKQIQQKPIPLPRFTEGGNPTVDGPLPSFSSNSTISEQEAGVLCKPWYAGACDRKSAEEALHRSNKDGSFLIRKSSGHDSKQPYTLVVFFNKRVYNIPVRFIEATKQYALGRKKNGEEYFGSVAEIIKNHQHSPLVLIDSQNNTKDSTRLKYAVKVS